MLILHHPKRVESIRDALESDVENYLMQFGPSCSRLARRDSSRPIWRPPKTRSLLKLFQIYLLAAQRVRKLEFRPGKPGFDARGNCRGWNYVGTTNSELLQCTCFCKVFRDERCLFSVYFGVLSNSRVTGICALLNYRKI